MMHNLLGKNGIDLHRKANGIDESPVVPYREQKSISTEETFQTDTIDTRFIYKELVRMTEKISFELRSQNRLAGCITVKIRYSDFQTETKQASIQYTVYTRRQLIRLIGVRFTDLIPGIHQIHLFDDTQELIKLYQAIDSVKKQYGENFLIRAAGCQTKHQPIAGKLFKGFKI
jgi:DNA polymerase-4